MSNCMYDRANSIETLSYLLKISLVIFNNLMKNTQNHQPALISYDLDWKDPILKDTSTFLILRDFLDFLVYFVIITLTGY